MKPTGYLLINKPAGLSSCALLARFKPHLPAGTRVGHAGTLDPFAEGLLLIGIGKEATKTLESIHQYEKTYYATGQLGIATTTLDWKGPIIAQDQSYDALAIPTAKALIEALAAFPLAPAVYRQEPPLYSACKHNGLPLYTLAREHILPPHELAAIRRDKATDRLLLECSLISYTYPFFTVKITCSTGTYIRVIIDDAAQKLETRATTVALKRTAIGPFTLEQAHHPDDLMSPEKIVAALLPVGT